MGSLVDNVWKQRTRSGNLDCVVRTALEQTKSRAIEEIREEDEDNLDFSNCNSMTRQEGCHKGQALANPLLEEQKPPRKLSFPEPPATPWSRPVTSFSKDCGKKPSAVPSWNTPAKHYFKKQQANGSLSLPIGTDSRPRAPSPANRDESMALPSCMAGVAEVLQRNSHSGTRSVRLSQRSFDSGRVGELLGVEVAQYSSVSSTGKAKGEAVEAEADGGPVEAGVDAGAAEEAAFGVGGVGCPSRRGH